MLSSLEEDHERTARLFGTAEVLVETMGLVVPMAVPVDFHQVMTVCRPAIGDDGFAAWTEGRTMSMEKMIACAAGNR